MNSIFTLLENIDFIICMHLLYGRKVRFGWKGMACILLTLIVLVLFSYNFFAHIVTVILFCIYTIFEFGFEKRKFITNIVLGYISIGIVELGCWSVVNVVFFIFYGQWPQISTVCCLVLNIITLLIILLLFPRLNLERFSDFMQQRVALVRIVFLMIFLCLFGILLRLWVTDYFPLSIEQYWVAIVSVFLLLGVTYMWQKSYYKSREQELQLQMHQMYDEGFQNLIADIRKRQHDFQNHLNTVYSLHYTCRTYEELVKEQQAYVEAIQTENRYYKMLSIGNPVIIGFLYGKFLQAETHNISVSYDIRIGDLQSKMPVHKMVEIIGNLFDNALEAIENSAREEVIYLEFTEDPKKIVFKIKNESNYITQDEKIKMFKKGESSKGKHRGFGLANVMQICKQYHCDLQVRNEKENEKIYLEFQITIAGEK